MIGESSSIDPCSLEIRHQREQEAYVDAQLAREAFLS
jgi:hypothetical protein